MYGAVHKSLFNNKLVDITRPLYSETFLQATESTGSTRVPFLFAFLGNVTTTSQTSFLNPQTAPIIIQGDTDQIIQEINNRYDNVITRALNLYVEPLGTGRYDLIDNNSSTYNSVINPLKTLSEDPNIDSIVQFVLDSVKAAGKVREMYDNIATLEQRILDERKKYEDLSTGLTYQDTFTSCDTGGSMILNQTVHLTPLMLKYIEIYGVPELGVGIDTIKMEEIKQELIAQGIDPYVHPEPISQPEPEPEPEPDESSFLNKNEPFSINGHFPLYYSLSGAESASPLSSAREFTFGENSYYMPNGIVEQFFGNYDEWVEFRKNETSFDNMIKDWQNDIDSGIENTFLAENNVPLYVDINFNVI